MRHSEWRYMLAVTALAIQAGCSANNSLPSGNLPQAAQPLAERPGTPPPPESTAVCDDALIQQILRPASIDPTPISLSCRAILPPNSTVTRQIVFSGSAASGSSLDCNGGRLEGSSPQGDREAIVIRSRKIGDSWSRPVGVTVQNCVIANGMRIYGLGRNGEAGDVRQSSMDAGHSIFAQAVAPSLIMLDNLHFRNSGGVPLYISPGVTNVTLTRSQFTGTSTSVAIYLDAESGGATITNNFFDLKTRKRELIAIDGSAYNTITGNSFNTASNGGIYLYRNCGEGGTIRHQAPQFNHIEVNNFAMNGSSKPAVWLNSRNGDRPYCFIDPVHPFGSAVTALDMAQYNTVASNTATGGTGKAFRNDDPTNRLADNIE